MDGIINTDDRGGGWAVPPIADTIQEFKVQSHNNDAQYGNVLGAVVNIVTKSRAPTSSTVRPGTSRAARSSTPATPSPASARLPVARTLANKLAKPGGRGSVELRRRLRPFSPVRLLRRSVISQNEFGGTVGGPIITQQDVFLCRLRRLAFLAASEFVRHRALAAGARRRFQRRGKSRVDRRRQRHQDRHHALHYLTTPSRNRAPIRRCPSPATPREVPWRLQNPGAAFGQAGYGLQLSGGTPCNRIPSGLIDPKLASVIAAYTASQLKNCAFSPNYTFAVDNCLDRRSKTDNANNYDFRIDHHFSDKNTVFGTRLHDVGHHHRHRRRHHVGDAQPVSTPGTSAAPGITSSRPT